MLGSWRLPFEFTAYSWSERLETDLGGWTGTGTMISELPFRMCVASLNNEECMKLDPLNNSAENLLVQIFVRVYEAT
jgi:hypothetical protein